MTLTAWHLKRLGKSANGALLIGVEGKRADLAAGSAVHKPWHSSSIVERVDSHTVRTASGSTYLLLGPITSGAGLNAHLSADFVSFFADGFPEDWLGAISRPASQASRQGAGVLTCREAADECVVLGARSREERDAQLRRSAVDLEEEQAMQPSQPGAQQEAQREAPAAKRVKAESKPVAVAAAPASAEPQEAGASPLELGN